MGDITREGLEWAITHLEHMGDTDLFPRPFEITVFSDMKNHILEKFIDLDISNYQWSSGRKMLIPRGNYSFRIAYQFDPLDSLVFTALLYEYGDNFESIRVPVSKDIVFSHRFKPDEYGRLYNPDIGMKEFWRKSIELTNNPDINYVVTLDIADFYNQIYHHTLDREYDRADIPNRVRKAIRSLLQISTNKESRGIPVGPHTTHLIAEIAMDSIDRGIMLQGIKYCRFSDDIHMFFETEEESQLGIYHVANSLYTNGRLIFQKEKTKIYDFADFLAIANERVNESPKSSAEKEMLEIIELYSLGDPYTFFEYTMIKKEDQKYFTENKIKEVFKKYLDAEEPNYDRIRWLLRRLSQLGIPTGIIYVVNNIEKFIPALGDAALFIKSGASVFSENWHNIGNRILDVLELEFFRINEYLEIILLNLFTKIYNLGNLSKLIRKYPTSNRGAQRKIILTMMKKDNHSWIRELKESFLNSGPWLRRAILFSSQILSKDELKPWFSVIDPDLTETELIIKKWILTKEETTWKDFVDFELDDEFQ